MEVDRRSFFATLGVGTLGLMDAEEKAEAVEHYMLDLLDEPAKAAAAAEEEEQQQGGSAPRHRAPSPPEERAARAHAG